MFIKILCCIVLFINYSYANNIENKYINISNNTELYKDKEWLSLVHYKKTIFNKYKSIITSDNFFLSKDGKTDPKKELEATIQSIFDKNTNEFTSNKKNKIEKHSICRFPARLEFLQKHLKIKNSELPKVNCVKYNEFFGEVKPESLTIIFPTAYINNPASMFGHTLIRIDKENSNNSNSQLDSIAINYGADTGGKLSGVLFAFKGVFGLYEGFYSAIQYYKTTNNYSNLENRNIWEFKTNYTKKETEYYTKHIWELIQTRSAYYFFHKNCSYYILDSLSFLRPETKLLDDIKIRTIPIETIKTLDNNNIIQSINYRASLQQTIKNAEKQLNKKELKSVKNIINNKEPVIENSAVYETAYKLLQYNKVKNKIDLKDYRKQSISILRKLNYYNDKANNNLNIDENNFNNIVSPEKGHKFNKIHFTYGYSNKNKDYLELVYKPSYHELTDYSDGFDFGSEINFFSTSLRYYFDTDKLELEKFDFVNIKSLVLQDYFFKSKSFSVLFGINDLYDFYKVLLLETNGGITIGNDKISLFLLAGPSANYSGYFDNNVNIGVNFNIGTLINFKKFKTIASYKINRFIDSKYNYGKLDINTDFSINKNFSIILNYNKQFYNYYKNNYNFSTGIKILF